MRCTDRPAQTATEESMIAAPYALHAAHAGSIRMWRTGAPCPFPPFAPLQVEMRDRMRHVSWGTGANVSDAPSLCASVVMLHTYV